MGLFDWLKRKMAATGNGRGFAFAPQWVRAAFPTMDWGALVREGYRQNAAVSACVTTLAFSFPEAPLLVGREDNGRFVPDYSHPAMRLIRQPNPDMGEVELMQYLIVYASVGGNAYLWKQRNRYGQVVALWPFSDFNIQPVPGHDTSEGFVAGYTFDAGDGQKHDLPKDDVIHWKWMPDPQQPWRGIGAIELAAREVNKSNEAASFVYSLLKNNAIPPVVVTLTEGEELTEEKATRLRKQWAARFGGENRGGVAFLEAGMKAERLAWSFKELETETLEGVPEARIAAAFRVPPVVAGLSVGIKRSDYGDQAARRAFTELTLAALWRSLASEMWNGLRDEFVFPPDYTLKFDIRGVLALQEDESKRWERVTLAYNRALITRAEAKRALGMEAGEGDDVYLVSLANEFISADAGEVRREKAAGGVAVKAAGRGRMTRLGRDLREMRERLVGRMAADLERLFELQARRAARRVGKDGLLTVETKISADELYDPDDEKTMQALVKRYYVEIMELTWNALNLALGVEKAFDLSDPLVVEIIASAGTRVKDITQTTLESLREILTQGAAEGWSVDDLAKRIREVVAQTYRGRAEVIARTELGWAQNTATAGRYREAGVTKVEILDGGPNDDFNCICPELDGQIWTLAYFVQHPLEHPNCTRAAAPYFGEAEPVR